MELSSRIVLKITVKEDVTIPPFTPDDVTLLFSDVDRPGGLVINHTDPTEYFILCQSDEHIPEVLKLVGTTEGMGTHMEIDLRRPGAELVVILGRLLEERPLKKDDEYGYFPIDAIENVEPMPHFTPKKGDVPPSAATVGGNIK